ncbi:hypothetical protein EJ08DRAFT_649113 [Tothia fuscella]|uniref:Uncharacterized protein n=1 Tax=Tothia fuscella TaxID=1048955 RepID=A0A9P4NTG1_9PEZI|nr:hypothetical protein EJ08DRAFT_649113 [Tothia fuscella]
MSYAPRETHKISEPVRDEAVGAITSDSLAAESLAEGGGFADGHATASKQPSKGTTLNNEDTSAARTLDPAVDSEARLATEEWNESAQFKAGRNLDSSGGGQSVQSNKKGGEYGGSLGRNRDDDDDDDKEEKGKSQGATAPSYTRDDRDETTQKPKGRNITEGGFDDSAPNASFNQDIGGKNDPGRLAEQKFAKDNASNPTRGGKEEAIDSEGKYDVLKSEEEA